MLKVSAAISNIVIPILGALKHVWIRSQLKQDKRWICIFCIDTGVLIFVVFVLLVLLKNCEAHHWHILERNMEKFGNQKVNQTFA